MSCHRSACLRHGLEPGRRGSGHRRHRPVCVPACAGVTADRRPRTAMHAETGTLHLRFQCVAVTRRAAYHFVNAEHAARGIAQSEPARYSLSLSIRLFGLPEAEETDRKQERTAPRVLLHASSGQFRAGSGSGDFGTRWHTTPNICMPGQEIPSESSTKSCTLVVVSFV